MDGISWRRSYPLALDTKATDRSRCGRTRERLAVPPDRTERPTDHPDVNAESLVVHQIAPTPNRSPDAERVSVWPSHQIHAPIAGRSAASLGPACAILPDNALPNCHKICMNHCTFWCLVLPAALVCALDAIADVEPPRRTTYEMVWANRTNDVMPPTIDFENVRMADRNELRDRP